MAHNTARSSGPAVITQKISEYRYQTLRGRDIRLLELSAWDPSDRLRGRLVHKALDDTGLYKALSYVWGRPDRNKKLETSDGTIFITASLDSALRRLRNTTYPRTFWVDAVCINQADARRKVVKSV
jgi:hypothetical protein